MRGLASLRSEQRDKRRLGLRLENVVAIVRDIVDATAKLTWVTAGYGWVSIVAPIVIASPAYFNTKLSFGELMVVVCAFYQVNQSLRWFVDNFALLAEWRAALPRIIKFREALSMSGNVAPTGKKAMLDVVELDVARRRSGLSSFQQSASHTSQPGNKRRDFAAVAIPPSYPPIRPAGVSEALDHA